MNNSNRREHEKTHSKFLYINVLEKEKKFAGCIVCDKSGVSVWISIGNHQLKLNSNIPCTVTEGWKKKTSRVLKKCATYTQYTYREEKQERRRKDTRSSISATVWTRNTHIYIYSTATSGDVEQCWVSIHYPAKCLGMSNIGHWVTGIALIKARDTCGVVIGFQSRSVHTGIWPPHHRPVCFSVYATTTAAAPRTQPTQPTAEREPSVVVYIYRCFSRIDFQNAFSHQKGKSSNTTLSNISWYNFSEDNKKHNPLHGRYPNPAAAIMHKVV